MLRWVPLIHCMLIVRDIDVVNLFAWLASSLFTIIFQLIFFLFSLAQSSHHTKHFNLTNSNMENR